MSNDFNIRTVERITALEVRADGTDVDLDQHGKQIQSIDAKLSSLVDEVRQIRNALYFMTAAIVANVPVLRDVLAPLLKLFP